MIFAWFVVVCCVLSFLQMFVLFGLCFICFFGGLFRDLKLISIVFVFGRTRCLQGGF